MTLSRHTPLAPGKPLAPVSAKKLKAAGGKVWSTFLPASARARSSKPKRPRYTGPSAEVRAMVHARSGRRCEFPNCPHRATCVHHRDERGMGGRGRNAPAWINEASNLLDACAWHNDWASNVSPAEAHAVGWLLRSGEIPALTPVLTRHYRSPVLLNDRGTWTLPEAVAS